jgi:uracil-DNA glycosylase family 4
MTTAYRWHVNQWKDCESCKLHLTRTNVVFARGTVPADVLFIGEGPGVSEDVLGKPFVGPAGKLLDFIISKAWELADSTATHALYNVVSCVPKDEKGKKVHTPDEEAIVACLPKVHEFVTICKPKLLVCVGKIADNWVRGNTKKTEKTAIYGYEAITVVHPAALLRMNISARPLETQRCVVTIVDALEEL